MVTLRRCFFHILDSVLLLLLYFANTRYISASKNEQVSYFCLLHTVYSNIGFIKNERRGRAVRVEVPADSRPID